MFAGFIIILRDFQAMIVLILFVFCFCLISAKKPSNKRMRKTTSTAERHAFYDRCSECWFCLCWLDYWRSWRSWLSLLSLLWKNKIFHGFRISRHS